VFSRLIAKTWERPTKKREEDNLKGGAKGGRQEIGKKEASKGERKVCIFRELERISYVVNTVIKEEKSRRVILWKS